MPRRSTGCERCRQRKVRCDELRPGCRNCHRYGIECPGYRPPADRDLRFIDQSKDSSVKADVQTYAQLQNVVLVGNKSRQYQWRHKFVTASGPRDEINKAHVHRAQLLSTFLDLYLPKQRDDLITSNFKYLVILPSIDMSSQLLQVAIDTLCTVEIGSLYQDERCLREAHASYIKALHMLTRELARPKLKQIPSEHILAAVTILAMCELFEPIAQASPNREGWLSHIEGAQQFLLENREGCLATPFGRLLFHNIRHSSLARGYAKRRAVVFAEPDWLRATEDLNEPDSFTDLYDLAVQAPGFLEQSDVLVSGSGDTDEKELLCKRICLLRKKLRIWLRKYYHDNRKAAYEIVDVRDMSTFAHLCLDRTFQTSFRFSNVQVCNQLQLYWISCLTLDFMLLDIYGNSQSTVHDEVSQIGGLSSDLEEQINRRMFVGATNYCRSLPYCCEPDIGSVGRLGNFFLAAVEKYFQRFGHCNELEWCKSVRRIFEKQPEANDSRRDVQSLPPALETAQANVKHRCKAPICNFRVECCAPAPLLMFDEYPKWEELHRDAS